ncbi:MAG: hypothetical protein B7Y83_01595 [Flavobacteriales bacterium 32-34-25]|nr:MAG: hypothetical protein B7Y83_01595 [Flavobacteriales bacterium 32-34-25]
MILLKILLFISGILGLIVSIILSKNYKSNKIINIYFILFLLIVSLRQLIIGIHYLYFENYSQDSSFEQSTFLILVLPLIYLYFKNLSMEIESFNGVEFLKIYIFPVLLFATICYQTHFMLQHEYIRYDLILYLIQVVFSMVYLFLCFEKISKKKWLTKESSTKKFQNSLLRKWTKLLTISILLIAIKHLFLFIMKIFNNEEPALFTYHPVTSIMILIICFKILYNPEIFYGYSFLNSKINKNQHFDLRFDNIWHISNNVTPKNQQDKALQNKIESNILKYIEQIEKTVLENDLLAKSDITINDIANKLNIPKSHLIYLFKYHSNVSFIELKKTVRVYYATKLIHDNFLKANTLNCLSKRVGFSSYDPFYRSFKEVTGNSPIEYYNLIRVNELTN